jgi:predicted Fe-Mo cluster-binding NifX family protein
MAVRKILIPLHGDEVAPRFDLAAEVWIGMMSDDGAVQEGRTVVLPQASSDSLCNLIVTEGVRVVICGGIEEEYYEYLRWKRVAVIDSVIGPYRKALEALGQSSLEPGAILFDREKTRER